MILVIRIAGDVKLTEKIRESLKRIRLRRKYSAVLIQENNENEKLLKKIRNFVAYGKIKEENIIKLLQIRGQMKNKKLKIDAKKIVSGIDKKKLDDFGLKPFFRLHPPRGGIESKKHFGKGKGVLGDNGEKINDLMERML